MGLLQFVLRVPFVPCPFCPFRVRICKKRDDVSERDTIPSTGRNSIHRPSLRKSHRENLFGFPERGLWKGQRDKRDRRDTLCKLICPFLVLFYSTSLWDKDVDAVGSSGNVDVRFVIHFCLFWKIKMNPSMYSWLNLPLIMDFLFNFTRISFFLASVICLFVSSLNKSFEHLVITRL